ncbi:hypothetical protein F5Y00DRAFT_264981 [Daldinia vernicosa]|uniref:uncharacterized protein n=1 Tax=Daldinia vernicosa TaxID=114800 RepID=UPI00200845FD|nr:uncharacterized protein F5Y00DRAFT_264981 [Daldinia vernicosa]KAI0846088.1 hypothetical protein F5Y00DRAFT_264981 [Daldinia vernicosa]
MLSQDDRDTIFRDNDYALGKLFDEFRMTPGAAWQKLPTAEYTEEDCLKGMSIHNWTMELLRTCRAFRMNDEIQQMEQIYRSLDSDLRCIVSAPNDLIGIDEYIKHIADRNEEWRANMVKKGKKTYPHQLHFH